MLNSYQSQGKGFVSGNVVSVFAGHDANVSFFNSKTNEIHVIELERLTRTRYFRLHVDNSRREIIRLLKECQQIAETHWGIENSYEAVLISSDGALTKGVLKKAFRSKNFLTVSKHHENHAACAFYQSPFEEATVVSFDGGGDDGFFNVYEAGEKGLRLVKKIESDFGGGYLLLASLLDEVSSSSSHSLALAGKMMGLAAYGAVIPELVQPVREFFFDRDFTKISHSLDLGFAADYNPWQDPLANAVFSGKRAYDMAATFQEAFEMAFKAVIDELTLTNPLCITGGGALNVLLNQRLLDELEVPVFCPPNPNDCGISFGHLANYLSPKSQIEITYQGLPLLDLKHLEVLQEQHEGTPVTKREIAERLKRGQIIGVVYGDSEVGPRALGNRSILCDPSFPAMKDELNHRIKFREWYRPFAPVCRVEDAQRFFESRDLEQMRFMSFAPRVQAKHRDKLPAITHVDGTSRLQTVAQDSNPNFFEILTEFSRISETPVLLNTSFNIRGKPILSKIEDALQALRDTELDAVVVEDILFEKKKS